jgi:predicted acetyltransferase
MLITPAREEHLPDIHKSGHDVWGDGIAEDAYIQLCLASPKYKKGQWYVLENEAGKIVSSLICYKNAFGLATGCAGIGSVTTAPAQRNKGYASLLVKGITGQLFGEKMEHIFLYADINPAFYEKLGFQVLSSQMQKHSPSFCMVLNAAPASKNITVPSYF